MRPKLKLVETSEQPMNWKRAFFSGVAGSMLLMGMIDIFSMLQWTGFSYERYLGSLLLRTPYGTYVWTIGLLGGWIVGGLFGLAYAYLFESVFKRSGSKLGALLGVAHAAFAAFIVFPFFNMLHQEAGTYAYWHIGFFGAGIDTRTPFFLLFSHVLFGASVGLFYGPVGYERVRTRTFEPGESGLEAEAEAPHGARDLISFEEDARDRTYT